MVEVFRLDDGSQSVVLKVAIEPSFRSGDHRYHNAELIVQSDWINTRTDLDVRIGGADDELTEWAELLQRLGDWEINGEPNTTVEWPSSGEGGYVRIAADDPYQVSVTDGPRTGITIQIPLDLPAEWLDVNTAMLDQARLRLTP
ncbi:DUF5959 family protein [Yinghuangia seranimata]|uniref:DUF5959 family protein n=1 Tax=Yinghuangia seranimata TaxID=408067 RepID=UPI00248B211F|nr:DUF5959 family protein [Yinghuangia seranimata]MDI2129571.1 DUF5959 family protein [Yinghuangia seranimata]